MTRPVLPIFYYLDHFIEMLSAVAKTYDPILLPAHRRFICDFGGLSKNAQCLLIRMVNRRGNVFRRTQLRYAEIIDAAGAFEELATFGYVRPLEPRDYADFLLCLPKDVLLRGARAVGLGAKGGWSKSRLIDVFRAEVAFDRASQHCGGEGFIALSKLEPLQFLLFLYFGKNEGDLKQFALRDLGIMRTNKMASVSSRFSDAEEASACFYYSRIVDLLDPQVPDTFAAAVDSLTAGPAATTNYADDLKSRAAFEIGQFFEKRKEHELSIRIYSIGSSPDCRERLVRCLHAHGDKSSAERLLQQMIDDPASDDEYSFAIDFYARKFDGQRIGACTDLLRSGRTIVVDDIRRDNPEAGVASVMRRSGWHVFFAENAIWQSLFGLLFWDELFESGQLHSNFDWMPQCLNDRSFARVFGDRIAAKLDLVRRGEGLALILRVIAAKWGTTNGVFAWDHFQIEGLKALLTLAPPSSIATMIETMSRDYRRTRDGFPDLMLMRGEELLFLEVKTEGDAVRRNQLTRLRQMRNAGLNAEIACVAYDFDPEQDYVVVDIETTGSWGNGDRITEIGAVKVRNHQIVGEWHTLVNPQRPIPAKITRLTGITNEMVREAPLFSEIADSFMEFMKDGIFVAHSVNFDYGFIAREFERLERRFRFPKLCTCASMRKRYPGHKSYGLGALCEVYGIELERHHRALYDAKAAAQLLNLINVRRIHKASSRDAA